MFYALSKTLDYLVMPVVWLVVLLLFAVFAKRTKWGRIALNISAGLFIFLTNHFLCNEALRAWELPPKKLTELPVYDAGILLTGITSFEKLPYDRVYIDRGADRIIHTLWLYREKKIKKIIISGGSPSVKKSAHGEGMELRKILLQAKVPSEDIILENNSRNTRENAVFTAALLKKHPELKSYLVITSAFHMRRSLACFKVAGVKVDGFPVDFYANARLFRVKDVIIPSEEAFRNWHILIHEVIGFIIYKIVGYC